MDKGQILAGVTATMTVDEKHETMSANAGITLDEFNSLVADEVADLFDVMALEDGEEPGTHGVSGSDVGDFLAEVSDEDLADIIAQRLLAQR